MEMAQYQKYDSYKDSREGWIGDCPEHWETRKLKRLFREKKHRTNMGLNCGAISFGEVVEKDDERVPLATKASYQEVLAGEFLVNPLNLNYDLKSLRIGLSEIDVVVSAGYIVLQATGEEIDKRYYKYLLHRYDVANMKLFGSGVRQTINFNHIANSILLAPSLEDQKQIARFLNDKTTKIDQAILIKEQQIALLKERKQIIIQEAVTKGLNPNAPMKDSGVDWIGEIPAHWDTTELRYVGQFQNGISEGADYFGEGFPFVTYGDVFNNMTLPSIPSGLAKSSDTDKEKYSVCAGDVFFTRTSEVADEIGISSTCMETIKDATFSGFIIRMRPRRGVLQSEYTKYLFRADYVREFFAMEMNMVTRASLAQDLLKDLPLFVPPPSEQSEISVYLEVETGKIDSATLLKENQIAVLKEFKASLINEAVTGKIKVV